jgi:hypothetical protein
MKLSETKTALLQAIQEMEVIDCHEHLGPESGRLAQPVDVLNLFSHYTRTDLLTAGMAPDDYERLADHRFPLELRWGLLRRFLPEVRFGGYARAAFIAARELYGAEDITDDNYQDISERMAADNTPGIYTRVLRERCKIRYSLTQCASTQLDCDILIPLMPAPMLCEITGWASVQQRARDFGCTVNTLDDWLGLMEVGLLKWKAEGAVGVKSRAMPIADGTRQEAFEAFESLRTGAAGQIPSLHPLNTWLHDRLMELCARHGMVVAVHAGMWGDFRQLDCKHFIPVFMRHPKTTFDLYHLSFPSVNDAVIIGKNFGNVYLNLCWTHIMSPTLSRFGMQLVLDFVPVNKVFAFGGDYQGRAVEKAIGHLRLAQEDLAHVLAERVVDGQMAEAQALEIAHKWLWDNPVKAYGLAV